MSKLTIKGEAKRKVEADTATITMRFQSREYTSATAANRVLMDSEKFLEIIKKLGVDLSQIHISNDEIEQNRYSDEVSVTATRELTFAVKYNTAFINDIMDIIQNNNMNVDLDLEYTLSTKDAVHEELLQEAVADSRKKAELIASSTGQKIVSIEEAKHGDDYSDNGMDWMCCESSLAEGHRKAMLSDQLKSPVLTETETVNITWIME